MNFLKEGLKGVLAKLQVDDFLAPEMAVKIDDNLEAVVDIVAKVHDALKDGLQWEDLKVLAPVIGDLVELAENMEGMSGKEKKEFVRDSVWVIYKFYDPDIPGIPEFMGIEDKLEFAVIPKAAEMALEVAVSIFKRFKD